MARVPFSAMWQPPAYSPLTHYFYTMGINEPHIYKAKPSKPWVPGTPEVGQQFGNAVPTEAERKPYLLQTLEGVQGPIVASSDYMKVVADQIAPWLPGRMVSLGTDGFGRSENREHLRKHFENGAEAIAAAALSRLARDGKFDKQRAKAAIGELGLDPESPDPVKT